MDEYQKKEYKEVIEKFFAPKYVGIPKKVFGNFYDKGIMYIFFNLKNNNYVQLLVLILIISIVFVIYFPILIVTHIFLKKLLLFLN